MDEKLQNMSDDSSDDSISDIEMDDELQISIVNKAKEQVLLDPLNKDAYVKLIEALQDIGDLVGARSVRENLNKMFPLTPDQWLDWIKNEKELCKTEDDKKSVIKLLKRAIDEAGTVKVWLEYLMFIFSMGDDELFEEVCNQSLFKAGHNTGDGNLIWDAIFLMQTQKFSLLSEENDDTKMTQHVEKMKELCRKRVSVPTMNMEENALKQAGIWFEGEIESSLETTLDKTLQKLENLKKYENELLRTSKDRVANIEAYLKYITYFISLKESTVKIQNLYDRAVQAWPLDTGLWTKYVSWAQVKFANNKQVLKDIAYKSMRYCPWSGDLFSRYIFALQVNTFGSISDLNSCVQEAMDRCLMSLESVEEQYMLPEAELMWLCYLEYQLRCFNWDKIKMQDDENKKARISKFRETAKSAIEELRSLNFPGYDVSICKLLADTEAKLGNVEECRQVWNELLDQKPYVGSLELWRQFIECERRVGDVVHARKWFRQALTRVWEGVELIGRDFANFERIDGDLETMQDFKRRYQSRLDVVEKRNLEMKAKEDLERGYNKKSKGKNGTNFEQKSPQKSKQSSFESSTKNNADEGNKKRKLKDESSVMPEKRSKTDTLQSVQTEVFAEKTNVAKGNESKTVFVSNLDFETDIEAVKSVFVGCGTVKQASLVRNFKGKSRGFAFVVFDEEISVKEAIKKDRTLIGIRPMYVSEYNTEKKGHEFRYSDSKEKDKLFVRNLPVSMTENEIREKFETHASVEEIRLVINRNGFSKGLCYMKFCDANTAEKVRKAMDQTDINGSIITVLISDPSAPKKEFNNKYVDKSLTAPADSARKTKLAFLPRTIACKKEESKPKLPNSEPVAEVNNKVQSNEESNNGQSVGGAKSNADFRSMLLKK